MLSFVVMIEETTSLYGKEFVKNADGVTVVSSQQQSIRVTKKKKKNISIYVGIQFKTWSNCRHTDTCAVLHRLWMNELSNRRMECIPRMGNSTLICLEMGLFVRTTGSLLVQLFRVPYRYPTAS
jgi:hypothetical protein